MGENANSMDDQKTLGRLEKSVEVLDKSMSDTRKEVGDSLKEVIATVADMRKENADAIKEVQNSLTDQTKELRGKIADALEKHTELRLSVQRLALTISLVVGVGLWILSKAGDALVQTLIHRS